RRPQPTAAAGKQRTTRSRILPDRGAFCPARAQGRRPHARDVRVVLLPLRSGDDGAAHRRSRVRPRVTAPAAAAKAPPEGPRCPNGRSVRARRGGAVRRRRTLDRRVRERKGEGEVGFLPVAGGGDGLPPQGGRRATGRRRERDAIPRRGRLGGGGAEGRAPGGGGLG